MDEVETLEAPATSEQTLLLEYMPKGPRVAGMPLEKLPDDLYVPPNALEVFLEAFEGPLDLLLYLIRKSNIDILDIPIAEITNQYIEYIELMKNMKLELAADYLVMAAVLAEIKSRMLLPRQEEDDEDDEDPRAKLIRQLQEYERFKQAAQDIYDLPTVGKHTFLGVAHPPETKAAPKLPELDMKELVMAFVDILRRTDLIAVHTIEKEALTVRERMSKILAQVDRNESLQFVHCFNLEEGKMGVVVCFLAVLELLREKLIDMVQNEAFGPIYLKRLNHE